MCTHNLLLLDHVRSMCYNCAAKVLSHRNQSLAFVTNWHVYFALVSVLLHGHRISIGTLRVHSTPLLPDYLVQCYSIPIAAYYFSQLIIRLYSSISPRTEQLSFLLVTMMRYRSAFLVRRYSSHASTIVAEILKSKIKEAEVTITDVPGKHLSLINILF